jgi:drug/metabolite transporter (DMT)-like permease
MTEQRKPASLLLILILAILAVSTSSIFIRYAQEDAPPLVIAALRLTFASLVLAPIALTRYRAELCGLSRRDLLLGMLSGIFLAIHFGTWISSLEYTSIASSVVLVSTGPLWVALLSPFILKEPLTRPVVIGMTLALIGGTVIGLSDACRLNGGLVCPPLPDFLQGRAFLGNFLALAGAWTVAGYFLIGRDLRARMSLVPYIFVVYSIAAAGLVLVMSIAGQTGLGLPPATYLWILLLALVPQLIGHSTYNWVLKYLPAALVSVTTLGEPIASVILAYFLLDETPTGLTIFGGLMILLGIYVSSLRKG